MTALRITIFCILIVMSSASADEPLTSLRDLQWENRILVITTGTRDPSEVESALKAGRKELLERDIVWFIVNGGRVRTNYPGPLSEAFEERLGKRYAAGENAFSISLIGKDGGEKARYDSLDLEAIHARIDSMPMRQAEMRRRN